MGSILLCAVRTPDMLSSSMSSVNEFFVTGLFSLAILIAMVRASLAQICCHFERGIGVPVFLLGVFVIGIALGIYLYPLFSNRRGSYYREDHWAEEGVISSLVEMNTRSKVRLRALPVFWVVDQKKSIFNSTLYTMGRKHDIPERDIKDTSSKLLC